MENKTPTTMNMPVVEHMLYRKLFPHVSFSKLINGLISDTGEKGFTTNKNYAFQIDKEDKEMLDRICKEWDLNHSEYLRNSLWIMILKKLSTLSYEEIQSTLDIIPNNQ